MKTGHTISAIVVAIASSGLVSTIVGTWLQDTFAQKTAYKNSRIALVKDLNENFTGYRIYRERLYEIAIFERDMTEQQKQFEHYYQIRNEYLALQNDYRHKLSADFFLAKHYFKNQETINMMNSYIRWDDNHQHDSIDKMVPDTAYSEQQDKIVSQILKQVQ